MENNVPNPKRELNSLQVDKSHYLFQTYSSERRFTSYYHQVKHVLGIITEHGGTKILVAGKGDGVVPKILEAYSDLLELGLIIHTYDFAEDLRPTYLGDLVEIEKIVTQKYDIIVCCQVLEHLPYEQAVAVLRSMSKLAKHVVLSLPYKTLTFRGTLKIPVFPELEFCIKIPIIKNTKGMVDERHYWELGASISVANFKKELKALNYEVRQAYTIKKHGNIFFLILNSNKGQEE